MNDNNVANLPTEAKSRKTELAPEPTRRATHAEAEEIFGLYHHTPSFFGITLADAIAVVRRRFLYLLIGAVAGIELALLAVALIPPLYGVSAQIVITKQDPGQGVDSDSGSSAFVATQAEVLHSPRVVEAAVASLPRPTFLEPEDDPVAKALDSVNASAISGTRVIALGYLGQDPAYGAALLNAMVEIYLAEVQSSARSDQSSLLEIKSAELDDLLGQIAQQEEEIRELRQANGIVGSADEAAAAQATRIDKSAQELSNARNRRFELESRLAAGGTIALSEDPLRTALQQELRIAEYELARARATLTAEHPSAVAAERNVEALRAQLATTAGGSRGALRQQIDEATRLEAQLAAVDKQARERLADIESHRREENRLLAELARMQSQADDWRRELLNQRVVSRLAQRGDVGIGASIIEKPVIPIAPIWPRKSLMLLAGAFFGLAIGFGLGLLSLHKQRKRNLSKS